MVEAVMLWNEPNNLSHWDFKIDPDWKMFANMVLAGAQAIRRVNPTVKLVLGGISPIDPNFINLLDSHGVIDAIDVIAVHGFPLDWNHWNINEWPAKIDEIREQAKGKPVWVSEAGASSFGADEVQTFGLQRSAELLVTSGCIGHTNLVSAGAEVGSSLIPHFGHFSGSWLTTSGCMGHA